MRTYEYDPAVYARKVTLIGGFCMVILVYSLYRICSGDEFLMWICAGIISVYAVWETFVSLGNPNKVIVDANSITFCAYGREHRYLWSEITQFRVKEFTGARKLFVRVNRAGLLRGRYWLNCYYFSDGEELYRYIVDQEYRIHPHSLKAQARTSGDQKHAGQTEEHK